jgi:hypothetical protein
MLGLGASGTVLTAQAGGLAWQAIAQESLTKGSYLNMINTTTSGSLSVFNGNLPATISVDATTTNTASKVVARDGSGNFAAGTITANLTGNVSGNAGSATQLQTARNINGVLFDGTSDITLPAASIDMSSRVAKSGDTMTGFLTLHANPSSGLHAATKQYVDSRVSQLTFTYGQVQSGSRTNIVGFWSDAGNFFDVFPPAGKSMGNLVAFIPSLNKVWYAGDVNADDAIRTNYSVQGDRIRVWVQNTEQNRDNPWGNYLAVWS